jgi:hypothetical protein
MILATRNRMGHLLLKSCSIRKIRRMILRTTKPRNFEKYNKVFCVGWLKTGTTSFGYAMRRLGFKHCGWDQDVWREWYNKGDVAKVIRYARYFESFDDLPWNMVEILEQLDKAYPASRFVLLERDSESWFGSLIKYQIKLGQQPVTGKEAAIKKYEERNEFVRRYFAGSKEGQLLVMNVTEGEGYEKLCPFLGLPVLNEPFPHSNKST